MKLLGIHVDSSKEGSRHCQEGEGGQTLMAVEGRTLFSHVNFIKVTVMKLLGTQVDASQEDSRHCLEGGGSQTLLAGKENN